MVKWNMLSCPCYMQYTNVPENDVLEKAELYNYTVEYAELD